MKKLTCQTCGSEEPIPSCCEQEMVREDEEYFCEECGNTKPHPTCCGEPMKEEKDLQEYDLEEEITPIEREDEEEEL